MYFFVFYVFFVLFCVFLRCSMHCLFCDVLCIVCVYMCTELLPPGGYPIAVKYIISYIISCIISYTISYHIYIYEIKAAVHDIVCALEVSLISSPLLSSCPIFGLCVDSRPPVHSILHIRFKWRQTFGHPSGLMSKNRCLRSCSSSLT